MARRLLIPLFLVSLGTFSHAAVYQWTDANGQTHFGDRPPAQASSSEVRVNAAPAQADTAARERHQKMTEFVNQQQQEREARQAAEAKARMQAERQSEACRKLHARLKHMESISTFYNLNDKGERVFVSEEQNLQIRDRFRASVREKCGG
ncbi:hypothetical protein Q666_08275 [Marinobacter sp. ES-1]|uniref:DUF4124 domain-containing protein n=1 Tax=Marinobacter vinifirmus TaxID=355591 RepID=A0A7Z1IMI2_9GAMM|nr:MULTISPECIES: DUF4124 domain-containing protein [Marinobacter]ERP94904.1 hypothetical protein Q666_08275 [Marinobacter sp. ES-1]OZC36295.1 DUF4124 domain-containing protein [Marinobacter vinifirmus]